MKLSSSKVEYLDHMGGDLDVCEAAWVSFDKWSDRNGVVRKDRTPKKREIELIRFLALHNHWTPFAHVVIKLRIRAPIFVRAQLFKSMVGAACNEVSRRYICSSVSMYAFSHLRLKSDDKKQGSGGTHPDSERLLAMIQESYRISDEYYEALINEDVCPEQARAVLPQGAMTEYVCTGTLEFFARLCALRMAPDAQAETREVAHQIAKVCTGIAPIAFRRRMDAHRITHAALVYADKLYKKGGFPEVAGTTLDAALPFTAVVESALEGMAEDAEQAALAEGIK